MGRKPTYAELEKRVMDLEQSSLSRSRAKGALRKYDLIFSAIEDPMGYIDSTYTCLAINDVFLAALNKTRQEIVGHTLDKLLGRKTFEEKIRPHLDICLSGQKSYLEDWFEYLHWDGISWQCISIPTSRMTVPSPGLRWWPGTCPRTIRTCASCRRRVTMWRMRSGSGPPSS
jgi:PAS domain-containing protein